MTIWANANLHFLRLELDQRVQSGVGVVESEHGVGCGFDCEKAQNRRLSQAGWESILTPPCTADQDIGKSICLFLYSRMDLGCCALVVINPPCPSQNEGGRNQQWRDRGFPASRPIVSPPCESPTAGQKTISVGLTE